MPNVPNPILIHPNPNFWVPDADADTCAVVMLSISNIDPSYMPKFSN
jgi:hypothetical protein